MLAEIGRMRNEPVPEKEFNEKKRAMVGSFALSLENPQQMIGYYVRAGEIACLPITGTSTLSASPL